VKCFVKNLAFYIVAFLAKRELRLVIAYASQKSCCYKEKRLVTVVMFLMSPFHFPSKIYYG
jgi:hypothetical protein